MPVRLHQKPLVVTLVQCSKTVFGMSRSQHFSVRFRMVSTCSAVEIVCESGSEASSGQYQTFVLSCLVILCASEEELPLSPCLPVRRRARAICE